MAEKRQKNQESKEGQEIINPSREGSCARSTYLQEPLKFEKHPLPCLLTPEQVSKLFNLKVRQLKELARQGRIPAVKVGRLWRFPVDSLRAWIEKNQTTHPSQAKINSVVDEIIDKVNNNSHYSRAVPREFESHE
jgi:excisionase family DNA binding protein